VIVRKDLPRGLQAAQLVHAAGESVEGPVPEGTHVVVLAVDDEEHLLHVAEQLHWSGIKHTLIVEPDLPLLPDRPLEDGQGTAIGIQPTRDRAALKPHLGRLRLLK
jgi:peptidyl-tRNA hydrolase